MPKKSWKPTVIGNPYKTYSDKKFPRCFYEPFLVKVANNPSNLYATLLPQVLWPGTSFKQQLMKLYIEYTHISKNKDVPPLSKISSRVTTATNFISLPATRSPRRLLHYQPQAPYVFTFMRTAELPVDHDVLYYMERFFGHCLIDRTGVLQRSSVAVAVLDPMPALDPTFSDSLKQLCDQRGTAIVERALAEWREIIVLWSGGIDSTAALVSLLRHFQSEKDKKTTTTISTTTEGITTTTTTVTSEAVTQGGQGLLPKTRLIVVYTDDSELEYPLFFAMLKQMPTDIMIFEHVTSFETLYTDHPAALIVTGELGDQIFGSMYMKAFFETAQAKVDVPNDMNGYAKLAHDLLNGTQTKLWREVIPDMLTNLEAIPKAAKGAWLKWMEPQVSASPIPIVTTFDFLWWLNFSLKWQHVSLRLIIAHGRGKSDDGGKEMKKNYDRTIHFFKTLQFQQWSYHKHASKMSDMNRWESYKVSPHPLSFLLPCL